MEITSHQLACIYLISNSIHTQFEIFNQRFYTHFKYLFFSAKTVMLLTDHIDQVNGGVVNCDISQMYPMKAVEILQNFIDSFVVAAAS